MALVGQIDPLAEPSPVPLPIGRRRFAGAPIGRYRFVIDMATL